MEFFGVKCGTGDFQFRTTVTEAELEAAGERRAADRSESSGALVGSPNASFGTQGRVVPKLRHGVGLARLRARCGARAEAAATSERGEATGLARTRIRRVTSPIVHRSRRLGADL